MNKVLETIKSLKNKIPPEGSLYIFGSCQFEDTTPNDVDLIWISDKELPPIFLKELYVNLSLKIDLFKIALDSFEQASKYPLHPDSHTLYMLRHRSKQISGQDLLEHIPGMSDDDIRITIQVTANYQMHVFHQTLKSWDLRKVLVNIGMLKYKFSFRTPTKSYDISMLKSSGDKLAELYAKLENGSPVTDEMVQITLEELQLINKIHWHRPQLFSSKWKGIMDEYAHFLVPPESYNDWKNGHDLWLIRPQELAKAPE